MPVDIVPAAHAALKRLALTMVAYMLPTTGDFAKADHDLGGGLDALEQLHGAHQRPDVASQAGSDSAGVEAQIPVARAWG